MVVDAAMVVSLMMNGLCCVWQEQNEQERRDVIRRDVRRECKRSRMMATKMYEQRQDIMLSVGLENYSLSNSKMKSNRMMAPTSETTRVFVSDDISASSAPPHYHNNSCNDTNRDYKSSRRWSYDSQRKQLEHDQLCHRATTVSLLDLAAESDNNDTHGEESSMVEIPLSPMPSRLY